MAASDKKELVWLITGCTSGFGEQFVKSALERGDKVIATGRGAEKRLAHLKELGAATVDLDVSLPLKEIKEIIDNAVKIYGRIDVLVNNAGKLSTGFFEETTNDDYMGQYNIFLFGSMNVTRAVLPHMRAQMSGTVTFVGSMYSNFATAGATTYSTAKHAISALNDALAMEVAAWNIRSCLFMPGYFVTEVMAPTNIQMSNPANQIEPYAAHRAAAISVFKNNGFGSNHRGDTKKGVEIMVDVIRGEGVAAGKKFPRRLVIGAEAVTSLKKKCEEDLRMLEEWSDIAGSTDREGWQQVEGIDAACTPLPYDM